MTLALPIFCLFILASALMSEYLHQTKQKQKRTTLDAITVLLGSIGLCVMLYTLFTLISRVFHIT